MYFSMGNIVCSYPAYWRKGSICNYCIKIWTASQYFGPSIPNNFIGQLIRQHVAQPIRQRLLFGQPITVIPSCVY